MRYHRQSEELEPAPAVPATADGIVIVGGGGMDATDGDADSGLMVSGRTGSRVPRPLAWAQLILGVLGFVLGATDVGIRAAAGASNATVVAFHSVRPVQAFDVTGAFGFPIWCSLSLRLYRLYSLFNLGIQSVGCLLLVVAWIALSQPSDSPSPDPTGVSPSQSPLQPQQQEHQQLRVFLALCSMVLTASWLLVLACVSCDWCVGKNLLQVLGIFVRTVFHRSQRDSFSELKRSTNSLNSMHMEPVSAMLLSCTIASNAKSLL
uniref:Transmembrane protein n=1 Tax=Macrostomum lignano TaxID=282301 RepID=A0A1I8G2S5_9PLAT